MSARARRRPPARLALAAVIVTAGGAGLAGPAVLAARGDAMIVLPAPRAPRDAASRNALPAPLPAAAWARVEAVRVPGVVVTAPLALDDGTVLVGHASPDGVSWVSPAGAVIRTAPLADRPDGELSLGAEGRVFVRAANQTVYTLAPDGTPRNSVSLGAPPFGDPVVRADGTLALVSNQGTSSGELITLSAAGDVAASRGLPGPVVARPALGRDGCLWVSLSSGIVCIDAAGAPARAPFGRAASAVAPAGADGVAAVLGNEVLVYAPSGAARARVDAGSPVQWLSALPRGGLALFRTGPPSELWVLAADGAVAARVPAPAGLAGGPLADPSGALLVVSRAGEAVALEPDGTERWRLDLRQPVTRAPVPLPGGGVAVATSSGALLLVR